MQEGCDLRLYYSAYIRSMTSVVTGGSRRDDDRGKEMLLPISLQTTVFLPKLTASDLEHCPGEKLKLTEFVLIR